MSQKSSDDSKMNMRPKGKRLLAFLLIITCGVMIAWFYERNIVIAITPSLAHRIFMRKSFHGQKIKIVKGDYVMFSLKHDWHALPEYKLLKKVACVGGETLKVTAEKKYYCNDKYLCKAKDRSLKGKKLNNFVFNGKIPPGKMFVMGHSKDSYDSRYFGLIPKGIVKLVAYPIW